MTASTWFSGLFGFEESEYSQTQSLLEADGEFLNILVDPPRRLRMGRLETPSLHELRRLCKEVKELQTKRGDQGKRLARISVYHVTADARALHLLPEANGAVIQMASQFNLLEMPTPTTSPEAGITNYVYDNTQGPACAVATAAATLYRNYLVPNGDRLGQNQGSQLNMLADLDKSLGIPGIRMQNGYAMIPEDTVTAIGKYLDTLNASALDGIRQQLRIGVHWGVGVTLQEAQPNQTATHALCSALPVAYNSAPVSSWTSFARLILEATYEATLLAAVLNHNRTGNPRVYLTFVGGGVFGNRREWILDAMERAIISLSDHPLEVIYVSHKSLQADVEERIKGIKKTLTKLKLPT